MTEPQRKTASDYVRESRQRAALVLASITLDQVTADALSRLVERTGRTRADLIRHLIRCADQDIDPMD